MEKVLQKIDNEWYEEMITDCKAIMVERSFNSRMEIIVGYHELGKRVSTDDNFVKHAKDNRSFIQQFAKDLDIGERSVYYAIAFFDKFPELETGLQTLPEGKNISWHMIVKKYLPVKKREPQKPTPKKVTCPNCAHIFELKKNPLDIKKEKE